MLFITCMCESICPSPSHTSWSRCCSKYFCPETHPSTPVPSKSSLCCIMMCCIASLVVLITPAPPAQVLQADGGTRCAAINAALLALADAGIPMRDMVAACAAGYLDGGLEGISGRKSVGGGVGWVRR